ncbi:MAG: hypothetical protein ACJAS1_007021 [Oleiphilaceae bacterium]|jgi:hypothetical protein
MSKLYLLIFTPFIFVGCSSKVQSTTIDKIDAQSYAIASCLTLQDSLYLKDQGDAWASVVVQRMNGSLDSLSKIFEVVKSEVSKGEMAVIRAEGLMNKDKELPILYCNEIIHKPNVQVVINTIIETSN